MVQNTNNESEKYFPISPDGIGEKPTPIGGFNPTDYEAAVRQSEIEGTRAAIEAHRLKKEASKTARRAFASEFWQGFRRQG